MKITCDVSKDLLPLYVENLASEDTRRLLEEHLLSCESCSRQKERMLSAKELPADTDATPLQKLSTVLFRKKLQTGFLSALLALLLLLLLAAYLITPIYLPYSKDVVALSENSDGTMLAAFGEKVTGYGVSSSSADSSAGSSYHIAAWSTVWDRLFGQNTGELNTVLNLDGEPVAAVYYYQTDGSGEVLLRGVQQNPCGVLIRAPKLSLCFAAAVVWAAVCGILLLLLHRNVACRNVLSILFLLPVSYLTGHLLCKGFSFASYSAAHDLTAILLAAAAVFLLLVSALSLGKRLAGNQSKRKK